MASTKTQVLKWLSRFIIQKIWCGKRSFGYECNLCERFICCDNSESFKMKHDCLCNPKYKYCFQIARKGSIPFVNSKKCRKVFSSRVFNFTAKNRREPDLTLPTGFPKVDRMERRQWSRPQKRFLPATKRKRKNSKIYWSKNCKTERFKIF